MHTPLVLFCILLVCILEYELARLYLPGSMHTVATQRRPGMADPGRLFPAAGMAYYGSTSYH